MFNARFKKCIWLFSGIIVFVICTGILMPDRMSVLTDSDRMVSERVLIPGGQSVGIRMNVKGALIVGVENKNAGPQAGDMIVSVNGRKVESPDDVSSAIGGSGSEAEITVIRNKRKLKYAVKPYYEESSGTYKLGFWIKEKIAGIGTLSFYDPETNRFAALGHGIYEAETGTLLTNRSGKLLHTKVNQITAGEKGLPGEIEGVIYDFHNPLGEIKKNTEFGIYGEADDAQDFDLNNPMVMGSREEICKGDAYILTTVKGTDVQKFKIKITRVRRQRSADSKGLEFQVTDRRLLETCGGIVQGMSGSPIIQNNRLVGVVTHVFVNNPEKGYGIFAEWMVEQTEDR